MSSNTKHAIAHLFFIFPLYIKYISFFVAAWGSFILHQVNIFLSDMDESRSHIQVTYSHLTQLQIFTSRMKIQHAWILNNWEFIAIILVQKLSGTITATFYCIFHSRTYIICNIKLKSQLVLTHTYSVHKNEQSYCKS
jgi:hypothetical protein